MRAFLSIFTSARASYTMSSAGTQSYSLGPKPKVLMMDDILLANKELERLHSKAEVIKCDAKNRREFIDKLRNDGDYSDVMGIYRHAGTSNSVSVTGPFDDELVQHLPEDVRFLVHNGAGYDQLHIPSFTKRHIQVANIPKVVDEATADTALFLLLGALRQFPVALQHCQRSFNREMPWLKAADPHNKVLGIIGAGGIGRALAYKASWALHMKVIYHNRNRLDGETEQSSAKDGMRYITSMEDLLKQSDVVSIHCPLTDSTRGMIGLRQLKMMKPSAILINTARGPIIKEADLAQALQENIIAGAGLDVFESEPTISSELLAHKDKALLLPHVGTLTRDTQYQAEALCLNNLINGLTYGNLMFVVPEQKHVKWWR
ncbi:unnamed protein product [Sympodiomycopsis kandeliae]